MPTFKQTLLFCSVSVCGISAGSAIAESIMDSFIDDTVMDSRLRTVYYDVHNKEKDETAGAWTGALWLGLKSGYLADVFALGGTFYGVTKLDMKDDNKHSYQLLIDEKINGRNYSDGFGKLGQAWVDLKIPQSVEAVSGHVKAGRQLVYTGSISSSGSRSVPSTWQGYKLEGSVSGLEIGFAFVDQMSLRDQSGFHDLVNFDGRQIDNIIGGELTYTFNLAENQTLRLKYRNAFANDFLQAHNGDIRFKTEVSNGMVLTVGGKYYQVQKDGDLWDGTAWWSPAFDDEATAGNLYAAIDVSSWNFRTGVSYITAETTKVKTPTSGYAAPGQYYYDYGQNTHGIWDLGTSGFAEDMIYDGETVWMMGATYDFSSVGAQGLEIGYAFHYGSGMEVTDPKGHKKSVAEYENDFHVIYKFPQPQLKGLKFKLKYGMYRNDEELRKAINKQEDDLRVWLDYDFTLF